MAIDTLDQILDNLWTSDYVQKNPNKSYKTQYNNEYVAVAEYMKGGTRPNPTNFSKMGRTLVGLQDNINAGVPVPPPPPPPPPPPSAGLTNPYLNEAFNRIYEPPWDSVQTTYGSFGPHSMWGDAGGTQDPSGRLSFVAAPDGVGRAARFEVRDSDPPWPTGSTPLSDRTQLEMSSQATWNKSALAVGDVRWFDLEFYMPTAFDFCRNPGFNTYMGLHPGANTWGCFDVSIDYATDPAWLTFKVAGGSPMGTTANLHYIKLWQVSNADKSPYMPNRNRRIHLKFGGRFAPDNTGWLEIWVDGVNIFPRTNRPTMWINDLHSYFKIGPYKAAADPFPSGSTLLYVTRIQIGQNP
jgi:Polysaccharide lyase